MSIHKENLIGKNIKVIDCPNKTIIGMQGKIIDETKNTIVVKTNDGEKTIIKDKAIIEIEGKESSIISKTSEERIKVQKT